MSTIIDVAKTAGVSTATVSRVINNSGRINADTVKKVLDAMDALNYHPNTIARSLVKGHNDCIGFLLPDLNMPFWAKLAHDVEKVARSYGYTIMISTAPKDLDAYIEAYNRLAGSMVCGIITNHIIGSCDFIRASRIPTITIANTNSDHSITSNDHQGGLFATKHLISRGCKYIVHISGELSKERSANARTYAFEEECKRTGTKYRIYEVMISTQVELDYGEIISKIFYENEGMDGIFASNDMVASTSLSTALSLGYKVPQDIKIIGYDDIPVSSMVYPPLTTIRQDYAKLASTSVESVLKLIKGEPVPAIQEFPVELIVRGTT